MRTRRTSWPPLWLAGAMLCWGLVAPEPLGAAEHRFSLFVDLGMLITDANESWLEGGLDKQRFKRNRTFEPGVGLLEYRGRWSDLLSARLTLSLEELASRGPDLTEAYLELHPVPRSALKLRAKLGAFYPSGGLVNSGPGWTSPYTLSFSAIDTWIAEEIRTTGVELELTHMGRFSGSPHDWGFNAALFRGNDPAGALLAWRGWALHAHQTGLFEELPFPDLPFYGPGHLYPPQEDYERPFAELDGRFGFYLGAKWDLLERSRLRLLHWDNRADPEVVVDGQWAWRTRFDQLSWQLRLPVGGELFVELLRGDTLMAGYLGGVDLTLVDVRFAAGSLLWSRAWGAHRVSLRADLFATSDHDRTRLDDNRERGEAWTAAYFWTLEATARPGPWRVGIEALLVRSDRPARQLQIRAPERSERSLILALQRRF